MLGEQIVAIAQRQVPPPVDHAQRPLPSAEGFAPADVFMKVPKHIHSFALALCLTDSSTRARQPAGLLPRREGGSAHGGPYG